MIRKSLVVAAGLGLLWSAPAFAGLTCTTTALGTSGTCSEQLTIAQAELGSLNGYALSVDLFDSSLGGAGTFATLTGMTLKLNATETLAGFLQNVSGGTLQGTATGSAQFTLTSPNATINADLASIFVSTNTVSDTINVPVTVSGPGTAITGTGIHSNLTQSGNSSISGPLGDFLASAISSPVVVDLGTFGSLGESTVGHGSQVVTNTTNYGQAVVTVTYDYSIQGVPEPMSMALLTTGLLGLGFVRRRFR